jgi:hypothetical protein
MEDLPVEIILKIFDFVNIRDLFQCMAVNTKIREIANDPSLWNKMHIDGVNFEADLPAELLSQILAKGCQYLSLFECQIVKPETTKFAKNLQLKYLCIDRSMTNYAFYENDVDASSFQILPDFANSCHNLEKLSIKRSDQLWEDPEITQNEFKFFKCIIQNSDTLKVLNLGETRLSLAYVKLIFSICQELIELNIATDIVSTSTQLCPESVDFICNNLTTTIEKLDITGQPNFRDDQIKTLIKRCNRLTELNFVGTNVTRKSMNTIIETLSESLVKLRPAFRLYVKSNLKDSKIAEPYPDIDLSDEEAGFVPNGIWEIKAKLRTYN